MPGAARDQSGRLWSILLRSTVMVVSKQQFRPLFAGFCVKSAVMAGYPALYGAAYHVSLPRARWHVHAVSPPEQHHSAPPPTATTTANAFLTGSPSNMDAFDE